MRFITTIANNLTGRLNIHATILFFMMIICATAASTGDHLAIYVADLFTTPFDPRAQVRAQDTQCIMGTGCIGPSIHHDLDAFESDYNTADQWFMAQIINSPLRVRDPACADVVFVPVVFTNNRTDYYQKLMDNPHAYLPHLGTIPHFMVLGQPRDAHAMRNDPLVTHANAKLFFYLTAVVPDIYDVLTVRTLPNYITIPYFHFIHWSPYSAWRHGSWDPHVILKEKKHLAAASFKIRPVLGHYNLTPEVQFSRIHTYEQCTAVADTSCVFFYAETKNWTRLQEIMHASWFVSQVRGDWYTRCSLSDVIAIGSIPVLPMEDMAPWMPFVDVLDWREYTEVLPETDIAAASEHGNCSCMLAGSGTVLRQDHYHDRRITGMLHRLRVNCSCGQDAVTFVHILQQRYPTTKALLAKLEAVWRVRRVYQYSIQPDHTVVRWGVRHEMHAHDDAFTFSLKALMRQLCRVHGVVGKCDGAG